MFLFDEPLVQSRRRAARADARRDRAPAQGARHHHDLCHARPDRGDDAGRPDRRAATPAHIEQIGSAARPLRRSRPTSFVAGFVGSPKMNFMAARVVEAERRRGNRRTCQSGRRRAFKQSLSQAAARDGQQGRRRRAARAFSATPGRATATSRKGRCRRASRRRPAMSMPAPAAANDARHRARIAADAGDAADVAVSIKAAGPFCSTTAARACADQIRGLQIRGRRSRLQGE